MNTILRLSLNAINRATPLINHEYKLWLYNWFVHGFRLGLPTGIGIEASTACNRRCDYCPQSVDPLPQKIISQRVWNKFIERCREFRWRGMICPISYNEFSLVPDSADMVRDMATVGQPLLFTNGDFPKVVEQWCLAGAASIVVTDHPVKRDGKLVKKDGWQRWLENIMAVAGKYPEIVRVQSLDEKHLHSQAGRVPYGRAFTSCQSQLGMGFGMEGNSILCCLDYRKNSNNFGNLMEKSFREIWYQPDYIKLRKDIYRGTPRTELCRKCFAEPPQSHVK